MNNLAKRRKKTVRPKKHFHTGKMNIPKPRKTQSTRNKKTKTEKRKKRRKQVNRTNRMQQTQQTEDTEQIEQPIQLILHENIEPENTMPEMGSLSKPLIFGRVYWNECGHCKRMDPYWGNLKQRLRTTVPSHEMFDVERDQFDENSNKIHSFLKPSSRLEIDGYPTMFRIDNGDLSYFDHDKHAKHDSMEENLYHFYIKG